MSERLDLPVSSAPQAATTQVPTATATHEQLRQESSSSSSATASPSTSTAADVRSSSISGTKPAGDSLCCEWGDCKQLLPNAEALYEHICERHVGRKSTNNLNLTCQWGNCKTTTVKRDHITSHIRVHVPLKPHKCPTCEKAFKRPQDLKKHVKTHADDSVLIQAPEPASRNPDLYAGGAPRAQYAAYTSGHYFEPLNAIQSQSYAPTAHYFQSHPHQAHSSYGNVYYALEQGHEGTQASYESKKRGYDALNEFFGDLKRRQFDTSSYAAVGQRLMSVQGLQLPMLSSGADCQVMSAPVVVGGGPAIGSYSSAGPPQPTPTYHLPPMSNARTKDDLITLDHVLEQMQNTIYESDENLQASGIGQPGAHYIHGGMSYRASPPIQLHRGHVAAVPSIGSVTSAHSPSVGTPALTPPSSVQSLSTARSPASVHTAHHASPVHDEGSSAMYPRLPASSIADGMAAGYPTTSSAAVPSTLSGTFDHDGRRRYTGGTLQRARPEVPERPVQMDVPSSEEEEGGRTPKGQTSKSEDTTRISASLIDPALSNDAQEAQRTAQAATEVAERADSKWVDKARIIEFLRNWVSSRLERGEFECDQQENTTLQYSETMEGVETEQSMAQGGSDSTQKEPSGAVMYPTLSMVDDEGDSEMK